MYVALEGIDTAGKSTQMEILRSTFSEAIFTCEPGGSDLGVRLREILLESQMKLSGRAEFLLFLSDRAEHIHQVILPNRSKLVISDRSMISGIAYAKGFDFDEALSLNLFATQGVKPDCVVLLELEREELVRRLSLKKQDKIEARGIEYLLEIQDRMIGACEALGVRLIRINASKSIQEISAQIIQNIQELRA